MPNEAPAPIYLPFITGGVVATEPEHDGPEPVDAEALCEQWRAMRPQGRQVMITDPTLMLYAAWAASDIITHGDIWAHQKSTGEWPNDAARRLGVWLPDYYGHGPEANNIESLAFNVRRAEDCLPRLLTSPGHKAHILGEVWAFWEQIRIGAAFAYNDPTPEGHWWTVGVFVAAPSMG